MASCRSSCTSSSAQASRCSTRSTTPGGGGSASATVTSAGSGSRRSASWPARSCSASGRRSSAPTGAGMSAVSRCGSRCGSRTRPRLPLRTSCRCRSSARGTVLANVTLRRSPGARNVFEGALSQPQEGEYEIRLVPLPSLEGAMPTANFRVEPPASEMERVPMNQPSCYAPRRSRAASSTRQSAARAPARLTQTTESTARYRPTHSDMEHLADARAVLQPAHHRMGVEETQANGMIAVAFDRRM